MQVVRAVRRRSACTGDPDWSGWSSELDNALDAALYTAKRACLGCPHRSARRTVPIYRHRRLIPIFSTVQEETTRARRKLIGIFSIVAVIGFRRAMAITWDRKRLAPPLKQIVCYTIATTIITTTEKRRVFLCCFSFLIPPRRPMYAIMYSVNSRTPK